MDDPFFALFFVLLTLSHKQAIPKRNAHYTTLQYSYV